MLVMFIQIVVTYSTDYVISVVTMPACE